MDTCGGGRFMKRHVPVSASPLSCTGVSGPFAVSWTPPFAFPKGVSGPFAFLDPAFGLPFGLPFCERLL
jgi:hypothetical protein